MACWLTAVASADGRAPAAPFSLSVVPAWHGFTKPGMVSEAMLSISAGRAGEGSIVVTSGAVRIETEVRFDPATRLLVPVPIPSQRSAQAQVQVYAAEVLQVTSAVEVQLLDPALSVVAVVDGVQTRGLVPSWSLAEQSKVLPVQVQSLPFFGASYQLLNALVIGSQQLHKLSPGQLRAFHDYLAACGILVLIGGAEQELEALRVRAGCGARQIVSSWSEASAALQRAAPAALPADTVLRELLPPGDPGTLRALLIFITGYWLVLLLVAKSAKSPLSLLLVPPLAALLAIAGWTRGEVQLRALTWAEMDHGDNVLRYTTLLDYTAVARAEYRITFPAAASLPEGVAQPAVREVYYYPEKNTFELQLATRLLSRQAFVVQGSGWSPSLVLRSDQHGVEVVNLTSEVLPEATLAWRGKPYRVPALAPKQEWRPPSIASSWRDSAQDQLLRLRALDDGAWLLLPWAPSLPVALSGGPVASSGWLLVRGNGNE